MATLAGKIVVVVGGTSGIGLGVAKCSLLSQAAHVVVASSKKANVDSALATLQKVITGNNLPGKVTGQVVDANDVEAIKQFTEGLSEIDHLVWTSGEAPGATAVAGGLDQVQAMHAVMNIRYWSPIACAKAVKIKAGGSITFTIGSAVFKPPPNWGVPASIAGAVDSLTRGLAVDLAPVRVNVISPGYVDTNLWNFMPKEQKDAILKQAAEKLLVKHVADGDEIAEAYLFVMKCNYVTGQTIHVEGGHLLV